MARSDPQDRHSHRELSVGERAGTAAGEQLGANVSANVSAYDRAVEGANVGGLAVFLGGRVAALRWEDVPSEAVHWAKVGILDTVGVTLAGSGEDASAAEHRQRET